MMDLRDDGEPVPLETLNNVEFPKRLGSIQLLRHDEADQRSQLLECTGTGQAVVPHVILDVEVLVIDPGGVFLYRHPGETLSIARDQV